MVQTKSSSSYLSSMRYATMHGSSVSTDRPLFFLTKGQRSLMPDSSEALESKGKRRPLYLGKRASDWNSIPKRNSEEDDEDRMKEDKRKPLYLGTPSWIQVAMCALSGAASICVCFFGWCLSLNPFSFATSLSLSLQNNKTVIPNFRRTMPSLSRGSSWNADVQIIISFIIPYHISFVMSFPLSFLFPIDTFVFCSKLYSSTVKTESRPCFL